MIVGVSNEEMGSDKLMIFNCCDLRGLLKMS